MISPVGTSDAASTQPGAQLRAWRLRNALSQSEVARMMGVGLRSFQRWEYGEHRTPALALIVLPELERRIRNARACQQKRIRRRAREAYRQRQEERREDERRRRLKRLGHADAKMFW